jgi:hypothetical protein
MRKTQATEFASVPIKVSVYARKHVDRHSHRFAWRRHRAHHADMLLYWPRSTDPGV